jgi:hypothetical protein
LVDWKVDQRVSSMAEMWVVLMVEQMAGMLEFELAD